MKLNATTEMMPVTWPSFSDIHPFAPAEQAAGYQVVTNVYLQTNLTQLQMFFFFLNFFLYVAFLHTTSNLIVFVVK